MRIALFAGQIVVWAPAKVNLFLEILGKRPDGYHDLVTAMLAVNLFDTLVLQPAPEGSLNLTSSEPGLSRAEDNLIVKAARLLQRETGRSDGAAIRLVKRIPMQAGLGGGSSDAAAALAGLNRLWNLRLSQAKLAELGGSLGSDVAFFLNGDAAWCTGRGEIVEPIAVGRALDLVLVCPPLGCSTPEVYRGLTVPANPVSGAGLRHAIQKGDIDAILSGLHNRLSESALRLAPPLSEYLEKLRNLGPEGVLLSGSGSTVFALCRSRAEAKGLARAYARNRLDKHDKVYVVRSRASPLPP